jgi:hypothetical protein
MYEFDKRLCALAGCPVIADISGAMAFNPNPVITAENDPILAHEICHVLAGREDFEIFVTALKARDDDEIFRHVLNLLYDWYHESLYGQYSGFLYSKLTELHKTVEYQPIGIKVLDDLEAGYLSRDPITKVLGEQGVAAEDAIDLIVIADLIIEELFPDQVKLFSHTRADIMGLLGIQPQGKGKSKMGSPRSDIDRLPERSSYYVSAVSRHFHVIKELTTLWKKNKYDWINNYYGEIDWKDLPGMLLGEKLSLPVWKLFQKIAVSRKIYLVIDRSGSTYGISDVIMDTAVIISESLRMLGVPISILDVGVTNAVVNDIDSPLDMPWFTPMSSGGTPLGEVCSLITKADHESYLLVVTDGRPDSWETLVSALNAFPGKNLTFVIGDSYGSYVEKIKNAIHVEPHTIIREMLHESTLT